MKIIPCLYMKTERKTNNNGFFLSLQILLIASHLVSYSCDSLTVLNRTYFVNEEFPHGVVSTRAASCTHSIGKVSFYYISILAYKISFSSRSWNILTVFF